MATRGTGLRQIADAAGVSTTTVSFVLNGKPGVSEKTRMHVLSVAERLGYQQRSQRRIIGVLIERLHVSAYSDPAVGRMIVGVEIEASRIGYHMLLASVEPGATGLPAMVAERQVSGLIVLGGGDISDQYIRALLAANIPLILADNYVNGLAASCVLGDNAMGAYLATRHLSELGHRRIAILEGPRKYKTLTERIEGYLRALDEVGTPPEPALMRKPLHGDSRKGFLETQALLALPAAQQPTAIFAVSDKTALGALEALKRAGVRIPEDMSLVGFDDIAECVQTTPTLTTVRYPLEGIGRMAARRLIDHIEGADVPSYKILLPTELVVRASSSSRTAATTIEELPALAPAATRGAAR
jgi:LacI family transcriptional regulator